jgi:hypothetical protein
MHLKIVRSKMPSDTLAALWFNESWTPLNHSLSADFSLLTKCMIDQLYVHAFGQQALLATTVWWVSDHKWSVVEISWGLLACSSVVLDSKRLRIMFVCVVFFKCRLHKHVIDDTKIITQPSIPLALKELKMCGPVLQGSSVLKRWRGSGVIH